MMDVFYRIGGQAPHLPWFLRRLEAQGLAAAPSGAGAARLPASWIGLECADGWLDLGRDGDQALAERAGHCRAIGLPFSELAGEWALASGEHGFMLLAGNPPSPGSSARAVLDALAPQPGCWLNSGPIHSARFCQRALSALLHAGLSSLPEPDGQPRALEWERQVSRQWQLADKLRQLAEAYLAERMGLLPPYESTPEAAAHYAANLARTLLLTLPDPSRWEQMRDALEACLNDGSRIEKNR
ncbi:hypothetical protein DK842_01730 [Chromobacterium phragmitis]|uniref:hypothetical protein n=1 Tax=Chromobacterium phragmitis TaxID=2202141 RepID=UPI000DECBB4A|nr:hypothetical protein [Chromobacterium phragmitis]AXE28747.1 hypothetical protein DK842_01730 [Chromobacterium phragmitis]